LGWAFSGVFSWAATGNAIARAIDTMEGIFMTIDFCRTGGYMAERVGLFLASFKQLTDYENRGQICFEAGQMPERLAGLRRWRPVPDAPAPAGAPARRPRPFLVKPRCN